MQCIKNKKDYRLAEQLLHGDVVIRSFKDVLPNWWVANFTGSLEQRDHGRISARMWHLRPLYKSTYRICHI